MSSDLLRFVDQLDEVAQAPAAPVERELSLVVFALDREHYALPIERVREVVRVADITRVPHAPKNIRGVMNLRGRILPVVEIRTRLGLTPGVITSHSRVVVVELNRRQVGLLVDSVGQVSRLGERSITAPPEEVRTAGADAISGVGHAGKRLLMLLDLDQVLRDNSLDTTSVVTP
jgi:purine-binding chemotaxis protein CheW